MSPNTPFSPIPSHTSLLFPRRHPNITFFHFLSSPQCFTSLLLILIRTLLFFTYYQIPPFSLLSISPANLLTSSSLVFHPIIYFSLYSHLLYLLLSFFSDHRKSNCHYPPTPSFHSSSFLPRPLLSDLPPFSGSPLLHIPSQLSPSLYHIVSLIVIFSSIPHISCFPLTTLLVLCSVPLPCLPILLHFQAPLKIGYIMPRYSLYV